jgi:acyl-CoA thioester hydrolase
MAHEFKLIRRVEFADTDMAGIMHFAHFFRFMESAEHAFLRSLGFSVMMTHEGRKYGWPRVHAECDYRRPFRFEDEVEVHLVVREKKEKSLTYDFTFRRAGDEADAVCATGSITAVCITWDEDTNQMKAVSIPAAMAEKISVAPALA